MIYNDITELVGDTPLLRVKRFAESSGVFSDILLKLEFFNPAGSTKDRAALYMLKKAFENGTLKKGDTVIEPTSGNTGIGLAMSASVLVFTLFSRCPTP